MTKYFRGWTGYPLETYLPRVTDKALAFTVNKGYGYEELFYLPKSQVIIGEPNEVGNVEILIPVWILRGKVDISRIEEIETDGDIVEI